MKFPRTKTFADSTVVGLMLAGLVVACYVFGRIHAELILVKECNLHQTMTLGADRYDCRTILRGAP